MVTFYPTVLKNLGRIGFCVGTGSEGEMTDTALDELETSNYVLKAQTW